MQALEDEFEIIGTEEVLEASEALKFAPDTSEPRELEEVKDEPLVSQTLSAAKSKSPAKRTPKAKEPKKTPAKKSSAKKTPSTKKAKSTEKKSTGRKSASKKKIAAPLAPVEEAVQEFSPEHEPEVQSPLPEPVMPVFDDVLMEEPVEEDEIIADADFHMSEAEEPEVPVVHVFEPVEEPVVEHVESPQQEHVTDEKSKKASVKKADKKEPEKSAPKKATTPAKK